MGSEKTVLVLQRYIQHHMLALLGMTRNSVPVKDNNDDFN